jgi:hypothetical protein
LSKCIKIKDKVMCFKTYDNILNVLRLPRIRKTYLLMQPIKSMQTNRFKIRWFHSQIISKITFYNRWKPTKLAVAHIDQ